MTTSPHTRPQSQRPAYGPRPSPTWGGPIDDLIRKHRDAMRDVWAKHVHELQHPQRASAA